MSELSEHKALGRYIKYQYPKVIFMSDGSGIFKSGWGQRMAWKDLKSSRGIPDIIILEPVNGFHGFVLELKKTNETITKRDGSWKTPHIKEQFDCLQSIRNKGYFATWGLGLSDAKSKVDDYLKGLYDRKD